MNRHPLMVVRARLRPQALDEFEAWHRRTHLPHILAIPGIIGGRRLRGRQELVGSHVMLYEFENESVIRQAFASTEAQVARQDWERWMSEVRELSVEIFAPLGPLPAYHQPN